MKYAKYLKENMKRFVFMFSLIFLLSAVINLLYLWISRDNNGRSILKIMELNPYIRYSEWILLTFSILYGFYYICCEAVKLGQELKNYRKSRF